MDTPFTPGFGVTPPILAMQGTPMEDFVAALAGRLPVGDRTVLISGPRGIGKTVLVAQLRGVATEHGWKPVTLHTAGDLLADLREHAVHLLRQVDPKATATRLTGGSSQVAGFGGGFTREVHEEYPRDAAPLEVLLERLTSMLADAGGGLLVTVDEIQSADPQQLQRIGQHIQDVVTRGLPMAFVAAGYTSGVDGLLAHAHTTFLRRAHRIEIGCVDVATAAEVVAQTVEAGGKRITGAAAAIAGEVSAGYPYLIQVVGSLAWANAEGRDVITAEHVEAARQEVVERMVDFVHAPALRDVGGRKREYLMAMLSDPEVSRVADIATRMGITASQQNVYRARLIRDELIRPAGHGEVTFGLPYLREALERQRDGAGRRPMTGYARPVKPVPPA